ncbi:MAG TPA: glycosyltransferase [Chthoniobacteraceae bacterium]|nr:glycosyltransferase [Chthoniobacteraceae bacterium]
MKICDLTQFYSPVSGGVKRYVSEKVRHLRAQTRDDEHILIIPGEADRVEAGERSRVYTIRSPLISRTSRYRVLLRLEEIERVLERERPDVIESGDPYQVAWKAIHSGAALGIPVVGFYHSHFPEAYLRSAQKFLGATATEFLLDFSRRYVRSLYNRFALTLVPSPALGGVLKEWGVTNVAQTDLGVDTGIFHPSPAGVAGTRAELGVPTGRRLLMYAGRLAPEKNTRTLFAAFAQLAREYPGEFHLLVVGDGHERAPLAQLARGLGGDATLSTAPRVAPALSWVPYCGDSARLAEYYRAADLFIHPGVQETFGLVTLEAQACGTPVVGIRGSYMDRIIHSGQTHWAAENSPASLAAAILETLRHPPAHTRAELGRQIAEQYSWERVFKRLFDLYHDVIEHRRE